MYDFNEVSKRKNRRKKRKLKNHTGLQFGDKLILTLKKNSIGSKQFFRLVFLLLFHSLTKKANKYTKIDTY